MKPHKNTILTLVLGLMLIASAAVMAQTPAQGDQQNKTEACCSMDSCCCCNGDSCPMKADGTAADAKHSCCGDSCKMKKTDAKNHADDHECCSCCGDSCDMMKHDGAMKHDATMKHDAKMKHGKADCCNAKNKKTTAKKAS